MMATREQITRVSEGMAGLLELVPECERIAKAHLECGEACYRGSQLLAVFMFLCGLAVVVIVIGVLQGFQVIFIMFATGLHFSPILIPIFVLSRLLLTHHERARRAIRQRCSSILHEVRAMRREEPGRGFADLIVIQKSVREIHSSCRRCPAHNESRIERGKPSSFECVYLLGNSRRNSQNQFRFRLTEQGDIEES